MKVITITDRYERKDLGTLLVTDSEVDMMLRLLETAIHPSVVHNISFDIVEPDRLDDVIVTLKMHHDAD